MEAACALITEAKSVTVISTTAEPVPALGEQIGKSLRVVSYSEAIFFRISGQNMMRRNGKNVSVRHNCSGYLHARKILLAFSISKGKASRSSLMRE